MTRETGPARASQPLVAVIGGGRWGWNLVSNLHELGALASVADPEESVRQRVTSELSGVKALPAADAAIASDVDAVVIATPAGTHADLAVSALQAGKHVFVEKPFTLNVADGERVVAAGREAGRILMVGHLLLYQPAIVWLRDYLASGAIGRVASLYQDRLNLGTVRSVENSLWSLGVHDVAAILYLVGEQPVRVATWGQVITQPGIQDDMHLHMLFAGRTEGHIHNSWLWPERRRRLTIVGKDAMVVYDETDQTVLLHRRYVNEDLSVADDGEELLLTGDPQPLRHELQHFLDCVATGTEPRSSGETAVDVIRVLETADAQMRALEEIH